MKEIKFRAWLLNKKLIEASKEWRMIYFSLNEIDNGLVKKIEGTSA